MTQEERFEEFIRMLLNSASFVSPTKNGDGDLPPQPLLLLKSDDI